jgi:hypothetical protein
MWRKPSALATYSSFEPGSVIAMNRSPALPGPTTSFTRSKKCCLKMFGSSVVPDFDDTMNKVRPRSTRASHARTCAGSVESSTESSAQPGTFPKVMRRTSGHRLEPPIPRSRMWVKPARRTSSAMRSRLSIRRSCSSTTSSHPSQLASSAPVQRVASRAQNRSIRPCSVHSRSVAETAASRSVGRVRVRRFGMSTPPAMLGARVRSG